MLINQVVVGERKAVHGKVSVDSGDTLRRKAVQEQV